MKAHTASQPLKAQGVIFHERFDWQPLWSARLGMIGIGIDAIFPSKGPVGIFITAAADFIGTIDPMGINGILGVIPTDITSRSLLLSCTGIHLHS